MSTEKVSFKDTLNLPRTDFPIRANPKQEDPALLERWEKDNLYRASFNCNPDAHKFILHDGPPYANGHLHLGHAYNKILKDIVTKAKRMMGYHVPVTPGWDCHGLPIELKVSQENPGLDPIALKSACRKYADHWVNIQREEFKNLGVLMDWDRPYTTMAASFEGKALEAFARLVGKGYIERKNKTVPWCPTDQTTLASAEIEYKDRKDPSIYVLFPLTKESQQALLDKDFQDPVYLLIWTTTPWTLPLNRAVLANPHALYTILEINNKNVIVGAGVADAICTILNVPKKVVREIPATDLLGARAQHPFIPNFSVPVLLDDSVGTTEGTAFVHSAPGAGPIDYEIGVKNSLEIFSPITADGKYTQEIEPKELAGMPITQGQGWVITELLNKDRLLFKTSITHSYPHCWRCSSGLIFRATPQWFFNLDKNNIQDKTVKAIENDINFIPEQGRNFLKATVAHRWEWCLSRQRVWGIPIPALLCRVCDYAYITPEFVNTIAQHIAGEGIEYWDQVTVKELVTAEIKCPYCDKQDFVKETDILDVWFDSGVTHYAVLYNNPELAFPADLYLEGVDQHRGWFQSSLLTSMVLEEKPPMRTIMTHGYTVDEKGQKMSKSKGNVVLPKDIIDKVGTDGLRLWVASIGHDSDPTVSPTLINNISEVYRKIRNTCRFLLSNLYDFNKECDSVSADQLLVLDRRALEELYQLNSKVIAEYNQANFTAVFHILAEYCAVDLSALYLDMVKDRLYVEKADGLPRRSAQTVLWYILDTLTKLIAPIMSFTAELLSDEYQKPDKKVSIHLQQFAQLHEVFEMLNLGDRYLPDQGVLFRLGSNFTASQLLNDLNILEKRNSEWELLYQIRDKVLRAIEKLREQSIVKLSLEAQVQVFIDLESEKYGVLKHFFKNFKNKEFLESFLKEFFIASQVRLLDTPTETMNVEDGVAVWVAKAEGTKCPRCWQWDITSDPQGLCRRCQSVLSR